MLAGEADVILPDWPAANGSPRHRLRRGQLAYYPADFPHTIEAVGERPASYLMLKWSGPASGSAAPLGASIHDLELDRPLEAGEGAVRLILEGPTRWLGRLHAHLSTRRLGTGYEAHVDAHDVILVTLEGHVETLGTSVGPHHVVVYGAGELHGLRGAASGTARYVVFEFDGPPSTGAPPLPGKAPPSPVAAANPVSAAPRPLPLRVALSVLAHSAVFWLRGLPRRFRG